MLVTRLELPYVAQRIHPIAVELCGVMSSLIGIAKLFREEKMRRQSSNEPRNFEAEIKPCLEGN